MALLKFDKKSLKLELTIGLEEEFKPTPNIKELGDELELLKKQTTEFIKKTWGDKQQDELMKLLGTSEVDKNIWKDYLESVYSPKVIDFSKKVSDVNKVICPGFKQELDKLVVED